MNGMTGALSAILAGRDAWYSLRTQAMAGPGGSWAELSMNIPGWPKRTQWADRVFEFGCSLLTKQLGAPVKILYNQGGCFALYRCRWEARELKTFAVELEDRQAVGRLWDIDCYDIDGSKVSRTALGLHERSCLMCNRPHLECIGSGRHARCEVRARAQAIAMDGLRLASKVVATRDPVQKTGEA